jgi:hypothetical protein
VSLPHTVWCSILFSNFAIPPQGQKSPQKLQSEPLHTVHGFQIPAVTLVGNILWFPEQFLLSHLTHMAELIDKKAQQTVQSRRQTYLQQKAQSLPKEVRTFCLQVWLEFSLSQFADGIVEIGIQSISRVYCFIFGNSNLDLQTDEGKIERWNSKAVHNVSVKMVTVRLN